MRVQWVLIYLGLLLWPAFLYCEERVELTDFITGEKVTMEELQATKEYGIRVTGVKENEFPGSGFAGF